MTIDLSSSHIKDFKQDLCTELFDNGYGSFQIGGLPAVFLVLFLFIHLSVILLVTDNSRGRV